MWLFLGIRIHSAGIEAVTYLLSDHVSLMLQAKNRLLEFGCANHNIKTFLLCFNDQKKKKKRNMMRGRYVYVFSLLNELKNHISIFIGYTYIFLKTHPFDVALWV